ncbi:MAG: hypothetical protein ACFB10_23425 [Salibacteraceae bacterium]
MRRSLCQWSFCFWVLLLGITACKGPDFCEEYSDPPVVTGTFEVTEGDLISITNNGDYDTYRWLVPRMTGIQSGPVSEEKTLALNAAVMEDTGSYQTWGQIEGCVSGVRNFTVSVLPAIPPCTPEDDELSYYGMTASGTEDFTEDEIQTTADNNIRSVFADNGDAGVSITFFGLLLPDRSRSYTIDNMPSNSSNLAQVRITIPNSSGMGPPVLNLSMDMGQRLYLILHDEDEYEFRVCDATFSDNMGNLTVNGTFSVFFTDEE